MSRPAVVTVSLMKKTALLLYVSYYVDFYIYTYKSVEKKGHDAFKMVSSVLNRTCNHSSRYSKRYLLCFKI